MRSKEEKSLGLSRLLELHLQLLKEEDKQKSKRAEWAHGLFDLTGSEIEFLAWCRTIGQRTQHQAEEYLVMARAWSVAQSDTRWQKLGGWRNIGLVRALPVEKQTQALKAALEQNTSVRHQIGKIPHVVKPHATPLPAKPKAVAAMNDTATLARYIADHMDDLPSLPPTIATVVKMYVPGAKLRERTA